ncbi:hypothetical protein BLNAU_18091 [Blattamonas nauphoetae]|nr:hypothetical protein BLNAU_18091 [Blattamonas nauphoetae]
MAVYYVICILYGRASRNLQRFDSIDLTPVLSLGRGGVYWVDFDEPPVLSVAFNSTMTFGFLDTFFVMQLVEVEAKMTSFERISVFSTVPLPTDPRTARWWSPICLSDIAAAQRPLRAQTSVQEPMRTGCPARAERETARLVVPLLPRQSAPSR